VRIALDASLWDEPTTGIGLYTRELHRALRSLGVQVERWGARRTGERPRRNSSRTRFFLDQVPQLLDREVPEVFHAVSNFNLPLQKIDGVRLVLTVHDLIPLLLPDTVSRAFRWQFRLWLTRSLKIADAVACVSETTRTSLLQHFDVDAAKVHTILNGVDHVERVAAPDRTTVQYLDALGLPPNFLLYAGALDARKNVGLVLRACTRLQREGRNPTLVIAGQRWFGSDAIEQDITRAKEAGLDVRALGFLADPVFYALMKRAHLFVFPSRYEGFGLPPLEAMRLGVPAIVSTAGALPEICGDAAVQVDPDDDGALAVQLKRLLDDPNAWALVAKLGKERAAALTWERTARQVLALYGPAEFRGG
jgi:glycosyltransferase involved in cell wall biosynthesis